MSTIPCLKTPQHQTKSQTNRWLKTILSGILIAIPLYFNELQSSYANNLKGAIARSLPNNEIIKSPEQKGRGKLIVRNGNSLDAIVKLIEPPTNRLIASLYVRSGQTAELTGIPDGSYQIIFAKGSDWNAETSTFTRDVGYIKFERIVEFITRTRPQGNSPVIEITIYKITLHSVPEGTATTTPISASEFNKYK